MTQFSNDHKNPPARFRASAGAMGQKVAAQALRPRAGGGAGAGRGRSGGGSKAQPAQAVAPPVEESPSDYRALMLLAQHKNMQDLGRDTPFGIWAINTGHFRGILGDKQPYDILDPHGD